MTTVVCLACGRHLRVINECQAVLAIVSQENADIAIVRKHSEVG